jgi:hypothetical protein
MNQEQLMWVQEGAKKRKSLSILGRQIAKVNPNDSYPHFYIYSKPGLGKTHTVKEALKDSNHEVYHLSAAESMWVFGINLCVLDHYTPKDKTIMVVLDDAENLLSSVDNINIFKNMLDGDRTYKYAKRMDNTLSQYSDEIQKAVQAHMSDTEVGFSVSTSRMSFVFTSNVKLPTYEDLAGKKPSQSSRVMHLLALRDRVRPKDFELSEMEMWGWIADTVLQPGVVDVPKQVVEEALDFTYNNWSVMKTKSIRLIQQMCDEWKNFPDDYQDIWEIDYK